MPLNRILFLLLMTALMFVSGNKETYAQAAKLPELSVPATADQDKDDDFNPSEAPNIQLRNNYLQDIVRLQYQVSLLQDLLERQRKIYEIQQTYDNLGVKFDAPAPPFDLCRLVPANIPCFEAYPYLYPRIQEMEEREKAKREAREAAIKAASSRANLPTRPQPQQKKETKPKVQPVKANYKWADVFCVGDECKAILVEIDNRDTRQTVLEGDELLDGSMVTLIRSGQVKIEKKGKTFTLEPAPAVSDGGPVSPLSVLYGAKATDKPVVEKATPGGNAALEAELFGQFGSDAETEVTDEEGTDVPPDTSDAGGVGPTGLF